MADSLLYTSDNPLFVAFVFYSTVLLLKLFFVQLSTTFHRVTKNIYVFEEDVKFASPSGKLKVDPNNAIVERTRRLHLNDLENIIPFIFLALFYISTQPAYSTALLVFRIFTAARVVHTVAMFTTSQPYRTIAFVVGVAVNIYMAVGIVLFYK